MVTELRSQGAALGLERPTLKVQFDSPVRPEVRNLAEHFDDFVIYEDDDILVLNKPAGVISEQSLPRYPYAAPEVASMVRGETIQPAHRLDMFTSGLLIMAKNDEALWNLQRQFQRRKVKKEYLALVDGWWPDDKIAGIIAPLTQPPAAIEVSTDPSAKEAATAFAPVAVYEDAEGHEKSLLRVRIFTGRTHQIRVHLKHLGFPIVGDRTYNNNGNGNGNLPRFFLHSAHIEFYHPVTGKPLSFDAPLTSDFESQLAKYKLLYKLD